MIDDEDDDFYSILMKQSQTLLRLFLLCLFSFLCGYLNLGILSFFVMFLLLVLWALSTFFRYNLRRGSFKRVQRRLASQTQPGYESAEFCNKLIDLMRRMYGRAIDAWFCEQLSSVIDSDCPEILKSLKIKDFSLGKPNPIIEGVKMNTDPSKKKMQLDLTLSWVSGLRANLHGKFRSPGVGFNVTIKNLTLIGRLRIIGTLHPTSTCFFGPLSVSFLERPMIDMDIKILGVNAMDIPGVGKLISEIISRHLIEQDLLWPNKIDVDLSDDSEGLVEAGEHVRQLKSTVQSTGIRDSDWQALYKQGILSSSFQPGRAIAVDIGGGVSRPVLCRVIRGSVRMEVCRNSPRIELGTCLNHGSEENISLQNLTPVSSREETHPLDSLTIAEFKSGDYFAEMTFVNPKVFSGSEPNEITSLVVFRACEETEVCVVPQSKLQESFGVLDGFQVRFYQMVAVNLSVNLRKYMGKVRETLEEDFSEGTNSPIPEKNKDWVAPVKPKRVKNFRSPQFGMSSPEHWEKKSKKRPGSFLRDSILLADDHNEEKKNRKFSVPRNDSPLIEADKKILQLDEIFEDSGPILSDIKHNKKERVRKVMSGMSTSVPRHIKQFTRSPNPMRPEKEKICTKVYYKDSSGKYVSRRVEVEDITLEKCKETMLMNIPTNKEKIDKYQFYVVPQDASQLQLQVGNVGVKTGTVVMIEACQGSGSVGYVVFHKNKFILDSSRPQERDQAAQFIVRTKGLIKLRDGSSATMISLKNVRANSYISRPTVGRKVKTSERVLYHEIIDVSSPTWTIFSHMMSDPIPFHLSSKNDKTIQVGKASEILQFSLILVDVEASAPSQGDKEDDSFDPTLPLDDSLLLPNVVRDHSNVSFVLHSEAPTDFHRGKLKESVRKGFKKGLEKKKKEDTMEEEKIFNKQYEVRRMLNIRQGEQLVHETQCRLCHNGGWISGRLYVFDHYVGFYGSFFANKITAVCRLDRVSEIEAKKKNLVLKNEIQEMEIRFRSAVILENVHSLLQKQCEIARASGEGENFPSMMTTGSVAVESNSTNETKGLTSDDWRFLLKGAKVRCYDKDAVILGEGQMTAGLYQISHGTVRIEKQKTFVAKLPAGEIFGEMSFLTGKEGTVASASVVSDEEEVDIYFIPNEYIYKSFQAKGLGGRFYAFLASCLSKRFFKTVQSNLES